MSTKYFVAKVDSFKSLQTCIDTGRWACRDRVADPQPRDVLTEAFGAGKVIIIFSVNNCHGWHGYAEMTSSPEEQGTCKASLLDKESTTSEITGHALCETNLACGYKSTDLPEEKIDKILISDANQERNASKSLKKNKVDQWHYFDVEWKVNFLKEFGEHCLPFRMTESYKTMSPDEIQLNKCRNWHELDSDTGTELCNMLHELYKKLTEKRDEKLQKQIENRPEPFYKENNQLTAEETWSKIVQQVERDLGKVILACPFGSQRYNLSIPESDTDMFIVYQARTKAVLGFSPPKQTVKSGESEGCDYTIHEVYRYCELLLGGDARCVETLFLHDSTVVQSSRELEQLRTHRHLLLNRECLDKYLRDAQGSKGTKYFNRWCQENKDVTTLPPKMCKMLYVIVRLLQNARDISLGQALQVYRDEGSEDRNTLLQIRAGNVDVAWAKNEIKRLEDIILENASTVPTKSADATKCVEEWLLNLRYSDSQKDL